MWKIDRGVWIEWRNRGYVEIGRDKLWVNDKVSIWKEKRGELRAGTNVAERGVCGRCKKRGKTRQE